MWVRKQQEIVFNSSLLGDTMQGSLMFEGENSRIIFDNGSAQCNAFDRVKVNQIISFL
jgi:hypothetical protein